MSSLVSSPKVAPLPQQPPEETAAQAGERERRKMLRGKTQTILTSGQGLADNNKPRTLLGGQ
jgi:hypothetical protein